MDVLIFIKIKDMAVSEFEDTTLSDIRKKENKLLSNTKYDGFKLNTFDRDGYDTQYVVRDNSQIMLITEDLIDRTKNSSFLFNSLNQDTKNKLLEKGWTEKKFNSVSQEERDTAIRCIEF